MPKVAVDHQNMVWYWCPGCAQSWGQGAHAVTVRQGERGWGWNGDCERPTFTPSVLCVVEYGPAKERRVCHSFVTDGRIQYLDDCTHALRGQTVDLPEPPDWLR